MSTALDAKNPRVRIGLEADDPATLTANPSLNACARAALAELPTKFGTRTVIAAGFVSSITIVCTSPTGPDTIWID
jgi:hypothetical protein